jgi:hypothetical protein
MKKLSAIAMALALLLMSSPAAYPQARQTTTTPPPVESTLVREGDFATRLVSALEIGMAENETEAETLLASAGIAPKNGWISDYPITPDILGELQETVAAAADSNRLPMGKDEALEVLDSVAVDLGLYVLSYTSGDYAETPPPASLQYTEPTVINNYYYREGPPVVTYYPPPPDYLYLYAWVPYHDFHKVSIIHKRAVAVSNHVFHRQHRRFYKIDPVKRRGERSLRALARRTHGRPHFTAEARRGARSILQRSHGRMASQRRLVNRNVAILKSPKVFKGRTRTKIARQTRARRGLVGVRAKTSPRQNIQKVHKNSARSFTALGKNQGKPFRDPTARGRDSSKAARQIRALNNRTGVRAKAFARQEVQRAHRDPARFFRASGISEGRSSSLPSMGKRDFSGGLRKGSKGFSGKVSRKIPGGSALKGALKLPF